MRYILLTALLAVAGCASDIMENFVGQDVSTAVLRYGPPVNVFDLPDGRRAFQWKMNSSYYVPQTTTFNAYGTGSYVSGSSTTTGGYAATQTCFYTIFGLPNTNDSYTITGFQKPRLACE